MVSKEGVFLIDWREICDEYSYGRTSVFHRIQDTRNFVNQRGFSAKGGEPRKVVAKPQKFQVKNVNLGGNDVSVAGSKQGKDVVTVELDDGINNELHGNVIKEVLTTKNTQVQHETVVELVDGSSNESDKLGDDEWDELPQLWNDQKAEVLEFLEAKRYPSFETVFQWNKQQYEYFYSLCEKYGMDPNGDGEDVNSVEGGMTGFMKNNGGNVQALGDGFK